MPKRTSILAVAGDAEMKSISGATVTEETIVHYERVEATPHPGFVIKTRKLLGNREKVFINVFHHEAVELEPPNTARNFTADNKPFLVMGDMTHCLDKEGHNCATYNVCISSEYFKIADSAETELKITSSTAVTKIIHKINLKYSEFLDENTFSLPKVSVGYVGESIPTMSIPVPVTRPPSTPSPATSGKPPTGGGGGGASRNNSLHQTRSSFTQRTSFTESNAGDDTYSVVSELTTDNASVAGVSRRPSNPNMGIAQGGGGRPNRKVQRKSVFDVSNGRRLINASMMEYIREECVDAEEAEAVTLRSVEDPFILLGWQIELKEGEQRGLYVVTDVKKNMMSKTEFRLSSAAAEDVWVKLKRAEGKSGLEFRPLRKVSYALGGADDFNGA